MKRLGGIALIIALAAGCTEKSSENEVRMPDKTGCSDRQSFEGVLEIGGASDDFIEYRLYSREELMPATPSPSIM